MKKYLLFSTILVLATLNGFSQSRSFNGKPIYQIITKRAGVYLGTTTVELFPAIAPLAVNNFDSLVSTQFYDSTAFHRVIPGFMIQGGDPNSRHGARSTWGYGDPTQPNVPAEFSVAKHVRGILSAARDTGINSANSQFFICVAPAAWLNGQYSVYGRVTSGMDIVDTIVMEPRDANDNPILKIEMFITYIGENDTLATVPNLVTPANNSYGTQTFRVLNWTAQSDGIIYHLDVSTDSTFATTIRSLDVGSNQYTCTGMISGNRYFWRVKSNNGGDTSAWSPTWNFSISGVGIESYAAADPVRISPNPSEGLFTFSGMKNESVVEVFDVTGRKVSVVVAKNSKSVIDLRSQAHGIYFYRILDGDKPVQQGKLVIE